MTKNYRDALTGKWTTAADAAARPAETVAEAVPTRHETPDVAELRRLLDATAAQIEADLHQGGDGHTDARLIVGAVNALPALLADTDALRAELAHADALRAELAHMRDARDNARAEVERLTALVDAVRALHEPRVVEVLGPECSAEECDHEDACPLVDCTVCGHCYDVGDGAHCYAYEEGGIENVAYPCATIHALDATPAGGAS